MNVKNLVLGIGIFIVYLLVLNYGIRAFYPQPRYEDFCTNQNYYYPGPEPVKQVLGGTVNCTVSPTPHDLDICIADGGSLIADTYDANGCAATFKCDTCNKEFTEKQKSYAQIVFIVALVVGILTLIAGYFFLTVEPIGSSLMASGVGALVYGSINNWQNISSVWKFILLLLALVLLVWMTLRLNSEKKNGLFGSRNKK
jgi:hypothetical protein